MKYKIGDYISLNWEGPGERYYIKGHIDFKEGKKIVLDNEGINTILDEPYYSYARWSIEINYEDGEWWQVLRESETRGKGIFPVTVYPKKGG
jgi:hypothetical protein